MSVPSPEDLLLAREDEEVLHRALERLPARYERAIRLWYGIGCDKQTLDVIGRQYGVTKSMIGVIIGKGTRKLAEASNPLRNHFRDRFPSIAREDRRRRDDAIAAKARQRAEQLEEMERLRNPPSPVSSYDMPTWRPPQTPGIDRAYLAFVRKRQRYAERLHAEAMAGEKAARERHEAEHARMQAEMARRPGWELPAFVPAYGIIRGFDRMLLQQTARYIERMNALCLPYQVRPHD